MITICIFKYRYIVYTTKWSNCLNCRYQIYVDFYQKQLEIYLWFDDEQKYEFESKSLRERNLFTDSYEMQCLVSHND